MRSERLVRHLGRQAAEVVRDVGRWKFIRIEKRGHPAGNVGVTVAHWARRRS